jgi:hypothetical protein
MPTTRGATKADARYYVFEMSVRDRRQPLRQVNKSPLPLEKAKQLARIGAQKGKHDRAVTTSPTSPRGFKIVAQYAAGVGKDVAIMYRRGSGGGARRKKVTRNAAEPAMEPNAPEPRTESLVVQPRAREVEVTEAPWQARMEPNEPAHDELPYEDEDGSPLVDTD